MATLNIRRAFSIQVNGLTITGKHGDSADGPDDYFAVTVDGKQLHVSDTLADDTVVTIFDDSVSKPADFDYAFIWSDVAMYLQLITTTLNVQIQLRAGVPFILGSDDILPVANTTILVGGAAPSFETVKKIVLSNNTGGTGNYVGFVVD